MKQSLSQAVSAGQFHRSTQENAEEQTEERFVAETGNSQPTSFVGQNPDKNDPAMRHHDSMKDTSLQVVEQNSSDFGPQQNQVHHARLMDDQKNLIDSSIHYYEPEQQLESGPT